MASIAGGTQSLVNLGRNYAACSEAPRHRRRKLHPKILWGRCLVAKPIEREHLYLCADCIYGLSEARAWQPFLLSNDERTHRRKFVPLTIMLYCTQKITTSLPGDSS